MSQAEPVEQPPVMSSSEVRRFRMHPKLLMDVIRRQAGTLEKAILEGVMNSIDAKASRVDVVLERGRVLIVDNGVGFPSRQEIEQFFEVFGQPHDASEGKVYGTFRMGRGQQFAFGRNCWRSGEFAMVVDIEQLGLDYRLQTGLPVDIGCRIEIDLYEPMDALRLHEVSRGLARLVKYAEVPILINGEQANRAASAHKWSHVTEDAWFDIKAGGQGGVAVYNLGVHVADLSSWTYGCSGVIATRRQVKVNFARNDIMSTCPVWRRILPVLNSLAGKEKIAPARMTASQRAALWKDIATARGDMTKYMEHKLFIDSNGDVRSLEFLLRNTARFGAAREYQRTGAKVCFAPHGSALADRVMQSRLALVLDPVMLEMANAHSEEAFVKMLSVIMGRDTVTRFSDVFTLVPLGSVTEQVENLSSRIIPEADISRNEKLALVVATRMAESIAEAVALSEIGENECVGQYQRRQLLWNRTRSHLRAVRAGESTIADGWTDGSTYVAVNRRFLKDLGRNDASFTELAMLLLHEWCHRTDSVGDHSHDLEFYQAYHDLSRAVGRIAMEGKAYFDSTMIREGRRVAARKQKEARATMVAEGMLASSANGVG